MLEEHLEIMYGDAGKVMEDFMLLARDEFISAMHACCQFQSKIAVDEKSDLALSTYVQYVEDFRFWMNVAGRVNRLPEKEIVCVLSVDLNRNRKKCIPTHSRPWTMLFGNQEKSYLLTVIFWKYQIELNNWNQEGFL